MRDPRKDWQSYKVDKIPTKEKAPDYLFVILEKERVKNILDLGCGCGRLAIDLAKRGYSVTGVDINEAAIREAEHQAAKLISAKSRARLRFLVGDITNLQIDNGPFDAVLLQLVISIIGKAEDWQQLIQQASSLLKSGGILYLSASGISDKINPRYAELYQRDLPLTGEKYSYFSEDPETGKVLYMTHHFSQEELEELLKKDFVIETLKKEKEVSSRRPTEPAYFFYIIARHK
jgi:SAM-dependent methyltransferase